MNLRFQNALKGIPQNTPPIWFMRQAGRYHSHYQNLKMKHTFMELCKQPSLAAEVALGPVQDFDFDVAILFSDLLFPLEALGMGLEYNPGPKLDTRLSFDVLKKLRPLSQAIEGVQFQKEAMIETRKLIPRDKSLIGFVGGPWTLFTYASEGEHKGNLIQAKTNFDLYRAFNEHLLPLLEKNIQLQLDGGAEVVMVLDTASGELSPENFKQFIQPDLVTLAQKFPGKLGYYSKGTTPYHLDEIRKVVDFAGFGIDHRFSMSEELKNTKHGFLQGNFDQALLFSGPQDFETQLELYLNPLRLLSREQRRHWVCGLGHGVLPQTPEAHVRTFVQRIREVFK